tara:strand:- start:12 stop:368 length:357 start_codon:yes stop_codon:yes gene_type:complete
MTNYDKRLNRLASILPDQAARLGCRRVDHELRARVENIPEDEPKREEVLERRRAMVRETPQVGSLVRITASFQTQGYTGRIVSWRGITGNRGFWLVALDGYSFDDPTEFSASDFEVIG